MLFSLSILLLLEFFQIILIEPFYHNTLRKEIKSLTEKVANVYFSDEQDDVKSGAVYAYVINNNACVLIYDTETGKASSFDAIGDSGCAIYNNGIINEMFIDELAATNENSLVLTGEYIELSNQEVMVYGLKVNTEKSQYYVFSNITLQSMNILSKTIQGQFIIISVIVLALALIISLVFSEFLTKPIINFKNEAAKLSYGDFNLKFDNIEITEMNQLGETLQAVAADISKSEEFQKELIANVSHDLKTPLTMIKAYSEMIRDISGDNKEKRDKHLNIILSETDNLNKLVQDMLNLSKLQANALHFNIEPFDLSSVINDSIEHFTPIAEGENVEIISEIDTELVAYGDIDRITEVVYNFISNALKHYGSDNKIFVRGYLKDKDTIRVEVQDNGTGIDEKLLPYIWDRYFKIDKKYQRSKTGTGLGLAICKAILEGHQAKYGVISKINVGSTFFFELKAYRIDEV